MTDLDLPAEVLAFRRVTSLGLTGFNALLSLAIILLDGLMGRNLTFGIVMGVVLTAIAAGSIRRAPTEPGARMMLGAVLAVTLMLLIYATRDYGPGPIQEAHMIFFVTSTFLVPLMCYRTQLVYSGATILHHAVLTLLAPKLVWDTVDTVTSVVNLGVHAFVVVTLVAPLLVLAGQMLRSAIANQRLLSDTRQMLDEATESRRLLDVAQSERLRADAALQERMQAEAAERDRQLSFSRDLQSQLSEQLRQILNSVTATSQTIGGSARRLTDSSQEMRQGSRDMLETAETVSSRLAGVATAANELAASVSGVSQQVAQAAENSAAAARLSHQAAATIGQLSNSGHVVNSVTDLIGEIAFRTTILAINAAVEAARAGESGRGFAVVAAEIRELANRTTAATKDVSSRIANMVDNTSQVVDIMAALAAAIGKADASSAAIATATEAQRAATDEIAQHVAAAAAMSDNTSHKLQGVAGLTEQMVARSEEVLQFVEALSGNVRRSEQEARRLVNSLAA